MKRRRPEWVAHEVVLAIHESQIAAHGGSPGIRDEGLLESALARPRNLFSYAKRPSLFQLAAAYAIGLVKNHPFIDGNKRVAWIVCALFLELNGRTVIADQASVVTMMRGTAAGSVTEAEFDAWLRQKNVSKLAQL